MLERVGGLQPEQRQLLLTEVYASGLADLPGLQQLIIVDGTYCTWTGQNAFLVLDTGETIQTLPAPPLETIGYNLNELWRRGISLVEKSTAHGKKNTAGSVEKS